MSNSSLAISSLQTKSITKNYSTINNPLNLEQKLTTVMYHNINTQPSNRKLSIHGVDVNTFCKQLDFYSSNYTIISPEDIIDTINLKTHLPTNPLLITFDDGYANQYTIAYPILKKRRLRCAFFPPVDSVFNQNILEDDKIQLILTSTNNAKHVSKKLMLAINSIKNDLNLKSADWYYNKYAIKSHHDDKETIFIKRMLQLELPKTFIKTFCANLFDEFVYADETDLADRLYMNSNQLTKMQSEGQHIGGHGYKHKWMSKLTSTETEKEVANTIAMLDTIKAPLCYRTFSYPHGDYNETTIQCLKKYNFKISFTAEQMDTNLTEHEMMSIPRFYPFIELPPSNRTLRVFDDWIPPPGMSASAVPCTVHFIAQAQT